MRCRFHAIGFLFFVCGTLACLAVPRMGIAPGNTNIAPNGSSTMSSRCLDEIEGAPTTNNRYTKLLTNDPQDITVKIGAADSIPMEQAVRDGMISITGNGGPEGTRVGNTISFDISQMRINNLTDQPLVVSVKRFTPIGTADHAQLAYDIGELAGLNQGELWRRQDQIAAKEREAKWALLRAKAEEHNAVVKGKEITNSIGMRFRLIPSGKFRMGSEQGYGAERPVHEVEITQPFYLGVTEVTQAQYEAVMGDNPSHFKGPKRPVENVRWTEAVAFCEKLSAKEVGVSYRLPTEAEWEYA